MSRCCSCWGMRRSLRHRKTLAIACASSDARRANMASISRAQCSYDSRVASSLASAASLACAAYASSLACATASCSNACATAASSRMRRTACVAALSVDASCLFLSLASARHDVYILTIFVLLKCIVSRGNAWAFVLFNQKYLSLSYCSSSGIWSCRFTPRN